MAAKHGIRSLLVLIFCTVAIQNDAIAQARLPKVAPSTKGGTKREVRKEEWSEYKGKGPLAPSSLSKLETKFNSSKPGIDAPPPPALLARLKATVEDAKQIVADAQNGDIDENLKVSEQRIHQSSEKIVFKFHSEDGKERAIAKYKKQLQFIENLNRRAILWATPSPDLHPWKLKTEDTGTLSWGVVVRRVIGPREMIVHVRQDGSLYAYNTGQMNLHDPIDILLKDYDTKDMVNGKAFILKGLFHVKGTEKIGEETIFVLEPSQNKT